ncbi:hypothetical protein CG709_11665 [Lachnotalea glycerini]|nr:hypothetical protein CG709_11665 [Lachnotalea glycerini]
MPVQIFSAFHNNSEYSPMYFRFEDGNHGIQMVEIKQILNYKEFYLSLILIRSLPRIERCWLLWLPPLHIN